MLQSIMTVLPLCIFVSVLTPVLYRCKGFATWRPTICCTKKTYGYFIKHVKATKNTVSKKAQYEKENPLSLVVARKNTQFVVNQK